MQIKLIDGVAIINELTPNTCAEIAELLLTEFGDKIPQFTMLSIITHKEILMQAIALTVKLPDGVDISDLGMTDFTAIIMAVKKQNATFLKMVMEFTKNLPEMK